MAAPLASHTLTERSSRLEPPGCMKAATPVLDGELDGVGEREERVGADH